MSELSRREEFAKAAMHAILSNQNVHPYCDLNLIVKTSREAADAQLKELRDNPSEYKTPKCDTGPG